jgi:peptide/nickel transport system permease protein
MVMYAGEIVEAGAVARVIARPIHPYTGSLLAANPRLAAVGKPIPSIPGSVPAPGDWPAGCHFADRCGFATDGCTAAPIALVVQNADDLARCVRADEIAEVVR